MCDSKKEGVNKSETNVTKTSPLIIRLCSKASDASPVISSADVKNKEISQANSLVISDCSVKGEIGSNSKTLNFLKLNVMQPKSSKFSHCVKSSIGKSKANDNFNVNKLKNWSSSNLLEDEVPEPKRRKFGQDLQEALKQSESNKLPLVMQSSNLHSVSGLDFGHDGGGTTTTDSRTDVEQHFIHDDDVLKPFHSKQTLEKEESGKTTNLPELLINKAKCEESSIAENCHLSSEEPQGQGRFPNQIKRKMQSVENSNNSCVKETENYETNNFTSDVIHSTLSCETHSNISKNSKTIVPEAHLAVTGKKNESFQDVDDVSTSQLSLQSLVSDVVDKSNPSEAVEFNEDVCLQLKQSPNKSNQIKSEADKIEGSNLSYHALAAVQSYLTSSEEMETDTDDDSVGYLEMTELEQVRESLREQLSQDNNSIEMPTHLEKLRKAKAEIINFLAQKNSISDESNDSGQNVDGKNSKPNSTSPIKKRNFKQKQACPIQKTDKQFLAHIPEKISTEVSVTATSKKSTSVADALPPVLQSSNLLVNDGLDNKHGGGSKEKSALKTNTKQDLSLNSLDSKDKNDSVIQNNDISKDNEAFVNGKVIESDNSQSDQAGNTPNDGQDGLMEFDILDEFESDDNDGDEDIYDDSDISTDEIDAMLEEGLMLRRTADGKKDIEHEEKEKVILKVRGRDHFDVLPEGWIEVTHNSGMPLYLHKQTRVCSVSKPYFLGPGSTRKHEIPVSAIPCLHYLKELEKEKIQAENKEKALAQEKAQTEEKEKILPDGEEKTQTVEKVTNVDGVAENGNVKSSEAKSFLVKNDNGKKAANSEKNMSPASNGVFLSAKLETVKDTKESGSLNYLELREYCKKRFEFQTITVKRFRTWSGRRKHQKQIKRKQRPFLPDNTKLITCPLLPSEKSSTTGNTTKREFIMNPTGKSPVCILHEYVQHTLRVQPKYIFKELESAKTPYGAIVLIDNIEYGYGFGSSKKLAKSDAAKAALEVLIPKMKMFTPDKNDCESQNVDFFDQVRVEDPRVCELSVKAGQPYPYQILLECLRRNYGMGDTEVQFMMKNLKHQKNEFYMKVGKHEISVVCKNKRDGKHRASQAILQKLHPHINSWGSLLRMYGKGSHKTMKEKKEEEQRITELQSQACVNKPNMSILNKLKEEMMKYREKVKSMKPIGKLIPERMECFSTSSSNLKNVEL